MNRIKLLPEYTSLFVGIFPSVFRYCSVVQLTVVLFCAWLLGMLWVNFDRKLASLLRVLQ